MSNLRPATRYGLVTYLCTTYVSGPSSLVLSHRLSDFHLLIWLSLVTMNMPLSTAEEAVDTTRSVRTPEKEVWRYFLAGTAYCSWVLRRCRDSRTRITPHQRSIFFSAAGYYFALVRTVCSFTKRAPKCYRVPGTRVAKKAQGCPKRYRSEKRCAPCCVVARGWFVVFILRTFPAIVLLAS